METYDVNGNFIEPDPEQQTFPIILFVEDIVFKGRKGIAELSLVDLSGNTLGEDVNVMVPFSEIYRAKIDLLVFWRGKLIDTVKTGWQVK